MPPKATPRYARIAKVAAALFLAAYLLFCHGCHPHDLDDELWANLQHLVTGLK